MRWPFKYLLQVSISECRKHESKGIDIRKRVDPNFEGRFCEGKTIAQYYQDLAKVSEDNKAIYVYVSPNELEPSQSHALTHSQQGQSQQIYSGQAV